MDVVSDGALHVWREWAEEGIRQYRMGRLRVRVIGPSGEPARGVPVTVRQKRHFFSFGTGLDPSMFEAEQAAPNAGDDVSATLLYQGMVKGMFNSASCASALSWQVTSPAPDVADFAALDRLVDWCDRQRMELRGENLLQENALPAWVQALPPDELERTLKERVQNICNRYRGRIHEYEVNTGMIHADAFKRPLGPGIVNQLFAWASEADPDASLYTSEPDILNGKDVTHYERLLEILAASGVPIHGIGCRAHFSATDLHMDRRTIWHVLDRLYRFGLPVKITDLTIAEDGVDPEAAARFLTDVLTLAFGHPAVEGVSLRHFVASSTLDAGGVALFDETLQPLAAGKAFRELVYDRWWTRAKHRTGDDGCVEVLAFFGVHELTVTLPGTNHTVTRHLTLDAGGVDGGMREAVVDFMQHKGETFGETASS